MPREFPLGQPLVVDASWTVAGVLTDPDAIVFTIEEPDGDILTYNWPPDGVIDQTSTGVFVAQFTPTKLGMHAYRMAASGAAAGVLEDTFLVTSEIAGGLSLILTPDDYEAVRLVLGVTVLDVPNSVIEARPFGPLAEAMALVEVDDWQDISAAFFGVVVSACSVANPTVLTVADSDPFHVGDSVVVAGHTGGTPSLNGTHTVTAIPDATSVTLDVEVTVAGTFSSGLLASVEGNVRWRFLGTAVQYLTASLIANTMARGGFVGLVRNEGQRTPEQWAKYATELWNIGQTYLEQAKSDTQEPVDVLQYGFPIILISGPTRKAAQSPWAVELARGMR
jgi:hypothetical protein